MSVEVKVPVLPESVSDATVDTWHKEAGDAVRRDENLVDLETDKVVLEVPAPRDGTLKEILKPSGETVTSEEVIAIIEEGDAKEGKEDEKKDETKKERTKKKEKAEGKKESDSDKPSARKKEKKTAEEKTRDEAEAAKEEKADDGGGAKADELSPAVRRLVTEHDLDPEAIPATGRGGRLTKGDVLAYLDRDQEPDEVHPPAPETERERPEERVAMSRLRARIAERLVEAQQTAAILTSFNEVDLSAIKALRARYRDEFEKQHDVRLGFMSFFVKASIEALKQYPVVNASIDENDIIYHGYYDIGIAVSTERGLVVPIIRDADRKSFAEIEVEIRDYAERAQKGRLTIDELTGGTFSITNGGVFGSLVSTPILNPPQSAILGMHAIKDRAVVVDGQIEIRPMMYLALSYDHRLIDGRDAVLFLVALKNALEDPARLLLQI